jgi:hypothetical protein
LNPLSDKDEEEESLQDKFDVGSIAAPGSSLDRGPDPDLGNVNKTAPSINKAQ